MVTTHGRFCSDPECGRPLKARGLCGPHYTRALKDGLLEIDPTRGRPRQFTDEERRERQRVAGRKRDKGRYARWSPERRQKHHEANARYRATVPEKAREWQRAANKRHRERNPLTDEQRAAKSDYMKGWWRDKGRDPDRVARQREYGARWRIENADRVAAKRAEWAKRNPAKYRLYAQNRRQRKRRNGGEGLSLDIVDTLMSRQRGRCIACTAKLKKVGYEIDHVVPLALGGAHHDSNVQLLCMPCNRSKGAKDPIEFMQEKGFLL